MNFLVDHQLPLALVTWLNIKGHQATHVYTQNMHQFQDIVVWDYAVRYSLIILTKDASFAKILLSQTEKTPVIWLRFSHCLKMDLLKSLDSVWQEIEYKLSKKEWVIEIY